MSVLSLEISPLKVPSIRTVSLKESFPSNSEPWSMNAVRLPKPPAAGAELLPFILATLSANGNPAAGGDPRSYAAADREDRDGWTAAIGDALEGHGRVLAALGRGRAPKTPLTHDDAIRRALEAAEHRYAKTEPNKKYGPRLYSPFQDPREFL